MPSFPLDWVRDQFPALALTDGGRPRIYLDNPAGTQVPAGVIGAVADCLTGANANLGGHFETSRRAGALVDGAHRAMADFLGADSADEIIIGPNMTSLAFQISRSLFRDFGAGDEIILTRMDHEGHIAPWLEAAAERGVTVHLLPFDAESWQVEPDRLARLLGPRTRLLALTYASNLTGAINEVRALTELAKSAGALVAIDAVQYAPHGLIDVAALGCDLLFCSSYKFFGPHLGILWGRRELLASLYAYKCRCVPDALPDKFETGTPQIELMAGLTATVDYLAALGQRLGDGGSRRSAFAAAFAGATDHEQALAGRLIAGLGQLDRVRIRGITNPNRMADRVPTISFQADGIDPTDIAAALAEQGIFVWNGHNYALEVVRQLGIDESAGVVRIGIAHYNSEAEIDRALEALAKTLR